MTASSLLLRDAVPSSCSSSYIDFRKVGLPEYAGLFAITIDNLLSPGECSALLATAELSTGGKWEQAMVNIGNGKQKMILDRRNCGRIILDDEDLAQRIQDRVMPHLPPDILALKNKPAITGKGSVRVGETWKLTRLNERLRFLKYTPGMYFRDHCDGSYVTPDGMEVSFLTIHVYLNGSPNTSDNDTLAGDRGNRPEGSSSGEVRAIPGAPTAADKMPVAEAEHDGSLDLVGGATRFFSWDGQKYFDYVPKTGSCLVFQHRHLIHSGEDVIHGTKYTMRTDVMYRKAETGLG